MNSNSSHRENAINEDEWQRQERALNEERLGTPAADHDARVLRYRMLARALRQPLHDALPPDFAEQVAHLAQAQTRPIETLDFRFENGLMGVLLLLFGVAAAAVIGLYGAEWLQPLATRLHGMHSTTMQWLLALTICVGLSRAIEIWRSGVR